MYAFPRRPWQLTSRSLLLQQPSCSCAPVIVLSAKSRHPTCHSQRLARSRLMRGSGEDAILARRCDVYVPATIPATQIMQLALTATILELHDSDRALSQGTSSHLPLSALVKVQVDLWEW